MVRPTDERGSGRTIPHHGAPSSPGCAFLARNLVSKPCGSRKNTACQAMTRLPLRRRWKASAGSFTAETAMREGKLKNCGSRIHPPDAAGFS
jgi:hypothetical protein